MSYHAIILYDDTFITYNCTLFKRLLDPQVHISATSHMSGYLLAATEPVTGAPNEQFLKHVLKTLLHVSWYKIP
jgi:hypothetical protein